MDRRSFLGRVIGMIAATQVPFRAEAVEMPRQASDKLRRIKAFVRTFELSTVQLKKFKVYGVTPNGERFWAPAIKEVDIDYVNLKASFAADPVNVTSAIQCSGMGLFDDRGIWIREMSCPAINMVNGDVLNMTYTANIDW